MKDAIRAFRLTSPLLNDIATMDSCVGHLRQVCKIFRMPIAIVSLVESERQWFKSIVGLEAAGSSRTESFCAWTLLPINPEVLIVEDASTDPR